MSQLSVSAERRMRVKHKIVWHCWCDFVNHHEKFLPKQFRDYKVEQGGFGDGTIISFTGLNGGIKRYFRQTVEEAVKNRVTIERDQNSDMVTVTTIEPESEGCRMHFQITWTPAKGIKGAIERLVAPSLLRKMLTQELALIESYCSTVTLEKQPEPA